MNRFKYLSVVLFSAVLAGVAFVSCNKNEPDPAADGKKAGEEMCSCTSGITEPANQEAYEAYLTELGICATPVVAKNHKYISVDISKYDENNPNPFSIFEFKDEVFKNSFLKAAGDCAKDNIIKK